MLGFIIRSFKFVQPHSELVTNLYFLLPKKTQISEKNEYKKDQNSFANKCTLVLCCCAVAICASVCSVCTGCCTE
jgi:hypothetical protein